MRTVRATFLLILLGLFAIAGCSPVKAGQQGGTPKTESPRTNQPAADRTFKILHVMSYHSPWEWTDVQLKGFQEALKDVKVEYEVFQMNAKLDDSKAWKEKNGREARELIDSWQPDLVYTTDDDAQEYVARYYNGQKTPFVFSGVNADPQTYGFVGSPNIAGVLEAVHFVESVSLLKGIAPTVKKVAVVFDPAPMWEPVRSRMKAELHKIPDVDFPIWDTMESYGEYQAKITAYQSQVDAIALIGVFHFKDDNGAIVPFPEVLRWTAQNSILPDFSFWKDRAIKGTLCTVTVSAFEQGLQAGTIARQILVDGKAPSSFPMVPTAKGEPIINLARANKLNLKVNTSLLLSSQVYTRFEWEQ